MRYARNLWVIFASVFTRRFKYMLYLPEVRNGALSSFRSAENQENNFLKLRTQIRPKKDSLGTVFCFLLSGCDTFSKHQTVWYSH